MTKMKEKICAYVNCDVKNQPADFRARDGRTYHREVCVQNMILMQMSYPTDTNRRDELIAAD